MADYIDFNDSSIPLGKRKQAFVRWRLKVGDSLEKAKLDCYKKFRREILSSGRVSQGRSPAPGYYLIVINSNRNLELLNCTQHAAPSDEIVAEVSKGKWFMMTLEARRDGINLNTVKKKVLLKYLSKVEEVE